MSEHTILRSAMLALHEVLADIEVDIAELDSATMTDKGRAHLRTNWQVKHDKLAQFYDVDVFLDRHVVSGYVSFLAEFPQCEDEHTGGGLS